MRLFVGFIFHKISFGLLSVLLPLYITQAISGGNLPVWGLIASIATFIAIPFSFLWGYLCDVTRRYRFFILLSFASLTLLLYIFSVTTDLLLLGIVYVLLAVFQVAFVPSKNVLIAENYSHRDWKRGFAYYAALTEIGWVTGLFLGFLLTFWGFSSATLLAICIVLSFVSFVLSAIFVTDPTLIFERGLVTIERSFSLVQRGVELLARLNFNQYDSGELTRENMYALCFGLMFFSLATSMFITPLPIFFAESLALPTSTVFAMFLLNSLGCLAGYLLMKRKHNSMRETSMTTRVSLIRGILVFTLLLVGHVASTWAILLSVTVLVLSGLVYALYSVSVLSLSMEVIPRGKTGLFTALLGAGSGIGCLTGPIIAEKFGFSYTFIASATCFLISYVAFKVFTRSRHLEFL
jgi:MFS family permease